MNHDLTNYLSAFDPIFYLHHCNVDRLFALWSAINPGVWVTQQQGPAGVVWNTNTGKSTNVILTPAMLTQTVPRTPTLLECSDYTVEICRDPSDHDFQLYLPRVSEG